MEYLPGGELFQYVWERDGLTEEQAKPLFYQIATAVAHCHKVENEYCLMVHTYSISLFIATVADYKSYK